MKKVAVLIFGLTLLWWGLFNEREAKILFVGDMFFDRQIRKISNENGGDYIFSCIGEFLNNYDLVVGNLEGPITENKSVSLGSVVGSHDNFIFTFPSTTAKLLKKNNIKLVNLGNNHISNFGQEGVASTKKYLKEANVNYFGDESIYHKSIGERKMSFISYNQFGGNSATKVAAKIKKEKEDDRLVIVYAHWGEEYSPVTKNMKDTATLFAKSGASVIIGSHPHIILPSEKIGETLVYYSLGNFIFDQYWNSNVSTGLALEFLFKDGRVIPLEHQVTLNRDGRTCIK